MTNLLWHSALQEIIIIVKMEFGIKYLPGANYLSRVLNLFAAPQQKLARGLLPKAAGNQKTSEQNHHIYVK